MKKIHLGIDPGLSGAIAILNPYDTHTVRVFDFKDREALSHLQWIAETSPGEVKAVIEKVSSHPGEGVSSAFNFGVSFGEWIGRLDALSIAYDFVHPAKWKKAMLDSITKGDKAQSISRALRVFPQMADFLKRKKDHSRAEALLLAEYARITDK